MTKVIVEQPRLHRVCKLGEGLRDSCVVQSARYKLIDSNFKSVWEVDGLLECYPNKIVKNFVALFLISVWFAIKVEIFWTMYLGLCCVYMSIEFYCWNYCTLACWREYHRKQCFVTKYSTNLIQRGGSKGSASEYVLYFHWCIKSIYNGLI